MKNSNEKFLLTIGIPTYNQPRDFEKTLASIVPQITSGVELLIRDDSTNNLSEEIVKKYSKLCSIRYIRGTEKIGIDRVDIYLIEEAKGEYVWLFGDDEMASGGVENVCRILKENKEISFLWVNSISKAGKELSIDLGPSRFFIDGNEALSKVSDLLNFISAMVFHRERALNIIPFAQKHIGTTLAAFYAVLCLLAREGKFYYVGEPYVIGGIRNQDEKLWYDSFKVYARDYPRLVKEFKSQFKRSAIRSALHLTLKGVWRAILVHRAKGYKNAGYGPDSVRMGILFKNSWTFLEFWFLLPFFLMPTFCLRFFYRIYKICFPNTLARMEV
jgi:glycosyltransferase involved in cell wall biosynthesis